MGDDSLSVVLCLGPFLEYQTPDTRMRLSIPLGRSVGRSSVGHRVSRLRQFPVKYFVMLLRTFYDILLVGEFITASAARAPICIPIFGR